MPVMTKLGELGQAGDKQSVFLESLTANEQHGNNGMEEWNNHGKIDPHVDVHLILLPSLTGHLHVHHIFL